MSRPGLLLRTLQLLRLTSAFPPAELKNKLGVQARMCLSPAEKYQRKSQRGVHVRVCASSASRCRCSSIRGEDGTRGDDRDVQRNRKPESSEE